MNNSGILKKAMEAYHQYKQSCLQEKYKKMLEQCYQALLINPDRAFLLCCKGRILNKLDRKYEAKETLTFALELVKAGLASDFVIETDRLLSQMALTILIKLQKHLLTLEVLSLTFSYNHECKTRLAELKTKQHLLFKKVFHFLIPDDYKILSEVIKSKDQIVHQTMKNALERIQKLEKRAFIYNEKFDHAILKEAKIKLGKIDELVGKFQEEITQLEKKSLDFKYDKLNNCVTSTCQTLNNKKTE